MSTPTAPLIPDLSKVSVETVTECIGGRVLASTIRPAIWEDYLLAFEKHQAGKCDHMLVVDKDCWPYELRSCFICGAGLGTV